jgi:hypothetical protein
MAIFCRENFILKHRIFHHVKTLKTNNLKMDTRSVPDSVSFIFDWTKWQGDRAPLLYTAQYKWTKPAVEYNLNASPASCPVRLLRKMIMSYISLIHSQTVPGPYSCSTIAYNWNTCCCLAWASCLPCRLVVLCSPPLPWRSKMMLTPQAICRDLVFSSILIVLDPALLLLQLDTSKPLYSSCIQCLGLDCVFSNTPMSLAK